MQLWQFSRLPCLSAQQSTCDGHDSGRIQGEPDVWQMGHATVGVKMASCVIKEEKRKRGCVGGTQTRLDQVATLFMT